MRHVVLRSLFAVVALAACGDDPATLTNGSQGLWHPPSPDAPAAGSSSGSAASGSSSSSSSSTPAPGPTPTSPPSPSPSPTGTSPAPTSTGTTPPPSTPEDVCVATINAYRKTLSLPPLARWTTTETCADGEAQNDGTKNVAHGAFPRCGEFGQNECPGWPGAPAQMIPQCLAAMWAEGPGGGHYQNMTSPQWTQVSCGFYVLPSGAVWSVQNFR